MLGLLYRIFVGTFSHPDDNWEEVDRRTIKVYFENEHVSTKEKILLRNKRNGNLKTYTYK